MTIAVAVFLVLTAIVEYSHNSWGFSLRYQIKSGVCDQKRTKTYEMTILMPFSDTNKPGPHKTLLYSQS